MSRLRQPLTNRDYVRADFFRADFFGRRPPGAGVESAPRRLRFFVAAFADVFAAFRDRKSVV